MKQLFFTLLFIGFSLFSNAQDTSNTQEKASSETVSENSHEIVLNWETDYAQAKKLAKETHKPLLVFFTGSDWCGPCKMLHKYFLETDKFMKIASKDLILYKADFPRRVDLVSAEQKTTNYKLKSQFAIRGFPTIVILNSEGLEIARRSGFSYDHDTQYHYALIQEAIKKNK